LELGRMEETIIGEYYIQKLKQKKLKLKTAMVLT
jgi:hypothetical protein